jgi:putative oxidoreductase
MSLSDRVQMHVLSLYRIIVGLLFACHGAASLFGVLGHRSIPVGTWPGWWAGLIQFAGGLFVMAGFGTRIAALICSGSMAYAYFTVHLHRALFPIQNGGEAAAMFCWAFLILAVFGPGHWSVDRFVTPAIRRRTLAAQTTPADETAT